ncbi:hypothetical protein QR685DRAFT_569708 [Neurospora intermedia]|uniref:Questionable protein n=1 Tax=Neurospora intermedia TaxID=5142 RepID=A0ABR3DM27_NEUIN
MITSTVCAMSSEQSIAPWRVNICRGLRHGTELHLRSLLGRMDRTSCRTHQERGQPAISFRTPDSGEILIAFQFQTNKAKGVASKLQHGATATYTCK